MRVTSWMASHTSCRKVLGGLGGITLDPNVFRRSSRSTGEPDIPVIQTVQSNMATVNTLILNSCLEWSHFLSWYFTRRSFSKVKHILDTSIVDYIQTCQKYTNYNYPKPYTRTSLKTCKSIFFLSCCKGIWNSVQVQSKFDKFSGLWPE